MRVKETMNDYRYFPEPDLAPLEISETWLQEIKAAMPLLPWEQEQKLVKEFGLPAYDAHFLADTREMAIYFEEVAVHSKAYKSISNWLMGPVKSHLNEKNQSISDFGLSPKTLAEIVDLVESSTLTHNLAAHQLFPLAIENPAKSPAQLVEEQGWLNAQSGDELNTWVQEAIATYPDKVKEYQKGKKGLIALFIGEVMKKSKGTADPKRVNQLMSEELAKA
jgi:aspartyl-tRNA(Asn)/glutamyl-tRNA(Gln) amidotransferase subunit B